MLLGVLDIGSNSAQLQVFEVRPGAPPLPTHAVKEPTLLGGAFDAHGAIEPPGIDRVVAAVRRAMRAAGRLGVQQLYVFTTSAVRDAANRDLAGAVVARATMKALNVDTVDVCPWALREGIVLHYLLTTHHGSFDLPLRPLAGTGYQSNGTRAVSQLAVVAAPAHASG
jgi:exopolyphosphatase/pppGpp-phosphohydrolase